MKGLDPGDHLEILNLIARYAHLIDLGPADQWPDCFTEDGEFDARPVAHCHGRAQLLEFAQLVVGSTRHWMSNTWISDTWSDGSTPYASAQTYLLSLRPGVAPTPGPTAVYRDRLRKGPSGWRIEYRLVDFEEPPDWPDPVE